MVKIYQKIHKFCDVISYFNTRRWYFTNTNVMVSPYYILILSKDISHLETLLNAGPLEEIGHKRQTNILLWHEWPWLGQLHTRVYVWHAAVSDERWSLDHSRRHQTNEKVSFVMIWLKVRCFLKHFLHLSFQTQSPAFHCRLRFKCLFGVLTLHNALQILLNIFYVKK